ncbi:MAG TPA: hypothetical protein QF761_00960 [Pirellulales bacterium]|jgi:hypothetical protein|nr:hypothetical protein [Pirellulales bacterium]
MGDVFGGAESQDLDMEARGQFVEDCLSRLQDAYKEALQEDISDPVLFLIDCEDRIGATIARSWEGDDAVDSAILANAECEHEERETEGRETEGRKTIATVLTRAISFEEGRRLVPELFPYLAISFQQPLPKGHFLVIVVADGGSATFFAPFS